MSVMFDTLERLEGKRDDVSPSFAAEAWSMIEEPSSVEPRGTKTFTTEPGIRNKLLRLALSATPTLQPADIPSRVLPTVATSRWAHRVPTFDSLSLWVRNVDLGKLFRLYPQPLLVSAMSAAVSFASFALPALTINLGLKRVQQAVHDRAAVVLTEDFRGGLDNWISRRDAPSWSLDAAGFVHPGGLALYRPSLGLVDYQMQFLGTIDKKALSWVVRAADFDNYYVVQLIVLKPGPLPTVGIARYAVINGKVQNRVMTPLAINARSDTVYRVRLDVRDDNFVLAVQDQLVDSWSEPRLPRGGVGFFSEEKQGSGVTGVKVRARYDVLGRLFAYFA